MAPQSANLQLLVALGIPKERAIYALSEHGDEVEAAADWAMGEGKEWTPQSLLSTHHAPPPDPFALDPTSPGAFDRLPPPPGAKVPPHRSVKPGVSVGIVLKQDQPTGRQVEGIVSEVLTRVDHPRGVKVRLKDGRVGRVQRLL